MKMSPNTILFVTQITFEFRKYVHTCCNHFQLKNYDTPTRVYNATSLWNFVHQTHVIRDLFIVYFRARDTLAVLVLSFKVFRVSRESLQRHHRAMKFKFPRNEISIDDIVNNILCNNSFLYEASRVQFNDSRNTEKWWNVTVKNNRVRRTRTFEQWNGDHDDDKSETTKFCSIKYDRVVILFEHVTTVEEFLHSEYKAVTSALIVPFSDNLSHFTSVRYSFRCMYHPWK